jgi:predicted dehydrogenase
MKLRVAGVGAGYFSQFHLQGWRGLGNIELVGWCDRDAAKVRELPAFDSLESMLEKTKPDVLDIVTPPQSHLELVRQAAGRGVAMVCQKPLAPTYGESVELVEAAERAGVLLAVHENFRFMPWHREAKRLIEAGRLGALHAIAFRLRPGDGQGANAYLDRQPYFRNMRRFLVHETAIHFIDTFRFLMGEVVAVSARLRRINTSLLGEDAGYIVFEFAGGATGLFDGNRLNDHPSANPRRTLGEMWLEGAQGVLRLDGDARLWWKPHREPEAEHRYDAGPADAFGGGACRALQAHVVDHLLRKTLLENSGRDYLQNLWIEDAVYRSHKEERRVCISSPERYP